MATVCDYIECPNCKNPDAYFEMNCRTQEEWMSCHNCGYHHSISFERDKEGKIILLNPELKSLRDNVIVKESLIANPFGAYQINSEKGGQWGTLPTRLERYELLAYVQSLPPDHNIQSVIISRFVNGTIEKEILLQKDAA
jgi:Zn ribbon nucleic-acid-binding protein